MAKIKHANISYAKKKNYAKFSQSTVGPRKRERWEEKITIAMFLPVQVHTIVQSKVNVSLTSNILPSTEKAMNLKRGTITVVFVLPGMLLLLVMTWLMGRGGRGRQERLQIISHGVVGPPPPHLHGESLTTASSGNMFISNIPYMVKYTTQY